MAKKAKAAKPIRVKVQVGPTKPAYGSRLKQEPKPGKKGKSAR